MSSHSLQLIAFIQRKLRAARRRLIQVNVVKGLVLLFGTLALLWSILAGIESLFWLAPAAKWFLVSVSSLALLFFLVWFVAWPAIRHSAWFNKGNETQLAKLIGRQSPEIGDTLLNFLQLSEGRHSSSPEPFVDMAVQKLGEPMREVPFEKGTRWSELRPLGKLTGIPVLLLFLLLIAAPNSFLSATNRVLNPNTTFERPSPFSFSVLPGNTEVIIGESVDVLIRVAGTYYPSETPVLETIVEGELRSRFVNLVEDSSKVLTHTYQNIRQPFRYRVSSAEVTSEWYSVTIVERPLVQEFSVLLSYPAYTGIPPRQLEPNIGDFSALIGSSASLSFKLSGASASEGQLDFESTRSVPIDLSGFTGSTRFVVQRADSYQISLRTSDGIVNIDPIAYTIETMADTSPSVTLLSPASIVDIPESFQIGVLAQITDDFGFRDLRLNYRVSESRFGETSEAFSSIDIPLENTRLLDQEIPFDWDLRLQSRLDPVPGDVIEYYVEVRDNDSVSGFKTAQSRIQRVRMPSISEQYESLDETKDTTENSIEELLEKANEAREQFQELKDELLQKPEADWQDERMLEQLQQNEEDLESTVDQISAQMEELAEQMSQNDLVSEDTMDMFEQLQEVVEEVKTPELMDALKQLQSAVENMDLNQMQEALEKFEFSEDMYQERLERTLDLFKQFRVQQDMEEIEKRADDLAKTEDKLAEETAKLENEQKEAEESSGENQQPGEKNEDLAKQQEMAAEEMKKLEEKMEEVRERMKDLKKAPSEEMQDLLEDTQDQQMSQEMNQNAEQLKENELQEAKEGQQEMSQQLSQLSAQMDQMQMSMQGAQMQLNIAAIRAALEDVLTLSKEQELLRLEVVDLTSESPLLRGAAQKQVQLTEGLTVVSDSLQRIAREIPQMTRDIQQRAGDGLREMSEATAALTERAGRRASGYQKGAMTNLNELALMLSELLNQQMNGSGAGQSNQSMEQMMEQLQQMGQQQQQINQQIQQLLNDMQGSRLTNDMMERLKQLGSQQEKMRGDLRQMSRDRSARNKVLGDLNRIADQMMESIEELQQNRVSRRTVERQEQILTSLLEASRSMQERGKDNKREGKSAEEILRASPADLPPSERLERLRKDLIRALETGYSNDYQALIRRYFEMLQQETSGIQN
jgi:hypothetical protein